MISPENNEPLQRRGHNSNVIGESIDGSSIAASNSPQHTMIQSRDKSGGVGGTSTDSKVLPITTLIRERQMGLVSPDNNNIDKKTKKKNKKKNDFNISDIFIPLEIKI